MKKLIILGTDQNYLNHIIYNINNIRDKHGEIDICILYDQKHDDVIKYRLQNYNVIFHGIKPINSDTFDHAYNLKYHIFETFFKNWNKILYLDCDTVIFDNLEPLFNLLNDEKKFFVDFEGIKIIDFFTMWCPRNQENDSDYLSLEKETDVYKNGFNGGILLYSTDVINNDTVQRLYELDKKYKFINKHVEKGSDQPIINLVYSDIVTQVPDNYFAFWRNYKNNLISHFCRWEAPWKNSDYNQKIGMTYVDYYNSMLK